MKKLSVLLVAAAVAISASAGVNFKSTHALKSNKIENKEMVKVNLAQLKAKADFRVINEQPAGEVKTYNRTGQYDYVSGGYLYCGQQAGNRMDIVYAEDGTTVYLKNILCGSGSSFGDNWVEGTIEGNEIHVALGQSIYWSDYYQADVVLAMGESVLTDDGYFAFVRDERAEEVVYVIDGETITLQGTEGPEELDGYDENSYLAYGLSAYWTDDDTWSGFLEWNTVLTEREPVVTPTVITEIPEGCQIYSYYRNSACIYNSFFGIGATATDGKFTVAFDLTNGDVYIQNPSWWHDYYGAWVKGTYDWMTGIISIPTGQYLTWSDAYEYGIVLGWGSTYAYEDGVDEDGEPAYYLGYEIDERTTEIQFMIDDNNIYLLGAEGDLNADFPLWANATGMMTYYSDDMSMTSIEFTNKDENGYDAPFGYMVNLVPAQPADPTADDWYDCGDETGYSRFYFTLPTTDVDGNMLDPEYVSYSVWVDYDGTNPEIFTFPAVDYTFDLYEDIDEVPYDLYSNAVDFHDYFVYMYRTNEYNPLFVRDEANGMFGNIGIQAFYNVPGERGRYASNVAWLNPQRPTSVNEMNAAKTVAGVRYYNVAGQEVAQPSGLTIKVTTYTDGTTSTVKVVK